MSDVSADDFLAKVGGVWIGLLTSDMTKDQKAEVLAGHFAIEHRIVLQWIAAKGRQQCAAVTSTGGWCTRLVGTHVDLDPRDWAQRDDGACASHR